MNVLVKELDGRFRAKLIDFCLSKSKISKNSKSNAGTPAYKCPEYGQEAPSGAVDMFSFGGILVYLFGEDHVHPFDDLDDDGVMRVMIPCHKHGKVLCAPNLETIDTNGNGNGNDRVYLSILLRCRRLRHIV